MSAAGAPGNRRAGPNSPSPVQRSWREVAEVARKCLELLDFPVPHCMPGEPDAAGCEGTEAQHAASYIGALLAVAEFRYDHLGPGGQAIADMGHDATVADLSMLPPCDNPEHGHVARG